MLARIENGQIAELRDIAISDVPEHKRAIWCEVTEEGEGGNAEYVVDGSRVILRRTPSPPVVPKIISDRQFFQQLAALGVITSVEALAAVGPGEIPAAMSAMVDALPENERFPAQMLLTGATQFDRSHPMVSVFGTAFGWTSEQLDTFWIAAAAL